MELLGELIYIAPCYVDRLQNLLTSIRRLTRLETVSVQTYLSTNLYLECVYWYILQTCLLQCSLPNQDISQSLLPISVLVLTIVTMPDSVSLSLQLVSDVPFAGVYSYPVHVRNGS